MLFLDDVFEAALELRRAVGGGLDEDLKGPAPGAQAQRFAPRLLGEVEEHELGERALPFERERGEGLDAVLVVEAPLRLDEALHVDLGHRGEEHRALDVAVDREPERDPLDDAVGGAGVAELQRQEELHVAARAARPRHDDVAGEHFGRELEQPRLEQAEHGDAHRGDRQAQCEQARLGKRLAKPRGQRERHGDDGRDDQQVFAHAAIPKGAV